jgi:hypothetical protein
MPLYNTAPVMPVLDHGEPIVVWAGEVVAPGSLSQQVALQEPNGFPDFCAVEIQFAANPGAFEIDLMSATTDQAPFYCQRSTCAVDNVTFVGRIEVTGIVARFLALYLKTLTNPVAVTASIF